MLQSKIIAGIITTLAVGAVVHFAVLKPEGIDLINFDFKLPKITNQFKKTKQTTLKASTPTRKRKYPNKKHKAAVIDQLNGVNVYDNGKVTNVYGRNTTTDGYNLGLRYQCVEFVKRYYYEHYNHKMPNSYGHAKEFFDSSLSDGQYNKDRALVQYRNLSQSKPRQGDLLVFGPTPQNKYGHVAIVARTGSDYIEIIQQNGGKGKPSRVNIPLGLKSDKWYIYGKHILGWLRKA